MAYDRELADRLRELLQHEPGLTEKAMFGGLAFLVNGNMAVSASGQGGLLLHIDPALAETLTQEAHAERFVMRGRAMDGWLRIGEQAIETDEGLTRWVAHGTAYARTLPPK